MTQQTESVLMTTQRPLCQRPNKKYLDDYENPDMDHDPEPDNNVIILQPTVEVLQKE
jgi:hypothetical protein